MKKGDIVEIYEQPLTKTKYVGIELWRVKFLIDGEYASRAIKVKGVK